jgi:C4-dicarboxylate transporter
MPPYDVATLWPILITEGIEFSAAAATQNGELSTIGETSGHSTTDSRHDGLEITVS